MTRVLAAAVASVFIACAHADGTGQSADQKPVVQPPPAQAQPVSTEQAKALADFSDRLRQYSELHNRLEATQPKLPKETNPAVIDTHERGLEKLMKVERQNAKPGDILTPATQQYFRKVLLQVFSGKDGAALKATILDENPGKIALTVNSRYPDEVPLSTVPPQVLAALPKLPEELEYRFIGDRLILLDVHAHTIADYMDNALPR